MYTRSSNVVRKCPCLALEGEGDKNHFVFECCDWLFGFGCFVEGRQGNLYSVVIHE